MSECPRCYVYSDLDGRYKIQYCSLHALAPWMAQWLSEIITERHTVQYLFELEQSTLAQLQKIGALDENGDIAEWVKEIKW